MTQLQAGLDCQNAMAACVSARGTVKGVWCLAATHGVPGFIEQ